jgi:hypothetical protein
MNQSVFIRVYSRRTYRRMMWSDWEHGHAKYDTRVPHSRFDAGKSTMLAENIRGFRGFRG